jgi:hypothetical protein
MPNASSDANPIYNAIRKETSYNAANEALRVEA